MVQDIAAQASKITVPVHIIVGGADIIEPEPYLRKVFASAVPHASFAVLDGVGHLYHLKLPQSHPLCTFVLILVNRHLNRRSAGFKFGK